MLNASFLTDFEVLILFSIFICSPSIMISSDLDLECFETLLLKRRRRRISDLRSEMEFTDPYKQTGPCCFSPNSRFLAIAVDYRLVIRDVLSLKVPPFLSLHLFHIALFGSLGFSFPALSLVYL